MDIRDAIIVMAKHFKSIFGLLMEPLYMFIKPILALSTQGRINICRAGGKGPIQNCLGLFWKKGPHPNPLQLHFYCVFCDIFRFYFFDFFKISGLAAGASSASGTVSTTVLDIHM